MNTKYFSKEKKLFEQNNDEINYQYVGNGLVIGSKTSKFKVVDDFKKDEEEVLNTPVIKNTNQDIVYAEEILQDDDLYGQGFKDRLLDKEAQRSFVDIGKGIDEAILKNGVKTNIGFELISSMQFSRIMMIDYLENSLEIMKPILKTLNSFSFIYNKNEIDEINHSQKLLSVFEYANKNKSIPVYIFLNKFEAEKIFDFLKAFYAYFDNPDGDNYINTFGKLNYIPHNLYFIISLDKNEFAYNIKRKLLRYISKIHFKAELVEEKQKYSLQTISLEELALSLKEVGDTFALNDDLWKKVDGLVDLISKTNGYYIHNKIEVRLENYMVAYSGKISDSYELLDITLANNIAHEAFITKDPSLYQDKIDIEAFINNSFGFDRMENVRKEFNEYLHFALKEVK